MLSNIWLWLRTFVVQDEEGQTLIEYGLILVLIAIVVILLLTQIGGGLNNIFQAVTNELDYQTNNYIEVNIPTKPLIRGFVGI